MGCFRLLKKSKKNVIFLILGFDSNGVFALYPPNRRGSAAVKIQIRNTIASKSAVDRIWMRFLTMLDVERDSWAAMSV